MRAVLSFDLGHGDDLIDDAGQLEAGFAAIDLRAENTAIKIVELFIENADKDDIASACMLEMGMLIAQRPSTAWTRMLRCSCGVDPLRTHRHLRAGR